MNVMIVGLWNSLKNEKGGREIFREIFTQPNSHQNVVDPFYSSIYDGYHSSTKAFLGLAAIDSQYAALINKVLEDDLLGHQRPAVYPRILTNLLMAGNKEAAEIIAKINPNLPFSPLPDLYYSEVPKTSIHYLEAFLKDEKSMSKSQITYFESDDGVSIKGSGLRRNYSSSW